MAETAAPLRPADQLAGGPAYDEDFFLWTQHQAALIRAARLELMDREHVAEEIESLGINDRRQHRSRSRRSTIRTQRGRMERVLKESPSLRREVGELSRDEYAAVREKASAETGFATGIFPKSLPYTPEQFLDDDFYPGPIEER